MRKHIFLLWLLIPVFGIADAARSSEIINGDDETVSRVGNMHVCPGAMLISGINIPDNWFLCSRGYGALFGAARVTAQTDQRIIPAGVRGAGGSMLSCRDNEMIDGIHVVNNEFRCRAVDPATAGRLRAFNLPVNPRDLRFVEQPTDVADRGRMMTCPRGFVMIAAHFGLGVLACARPPVCASNTNCEAGKQCRSLSPSSVIQACQ